MPYINFKQLEQQALKAGVSVGNISTKQELIQKLCSDLNVSGNFLSKLKDTAWLTETPSESVLDPDALELLFLTAAYSRVIKEDSNNSRQKVAQSLYNAIDHIIQHHTAEQLQKFLGEKITQGKFADTTPCYWLMSALNETAEKNPENIAHTIQALFKKCTPEQIVTMMSEKRTQGDFIGATPCYWLINAPVIDALFEKCSSTQLAEMLSKKITQGNFAGATPCYWLMNALGKAEKNPKNIAHTIQALFKKCTSEQIVTMMSEKRTQGEDADITPCYCLMSALNWSAVKNPENINTIVPMIQTLFKKCSGEQISAMMSEKIMQGELADTTPCYCLMSALNWSAQKNPENIETMIPMIQVLFEKCDSTQIVTMLSEKDKNGNNGVQFALKSLSKIQDEKIREELAFVLFRLFGKLKAIQLPKEILSKWLELKSQLSLLLKQFINSNPDMDAVEFKNMCSPTTVLGKLIDEKVNPLGQTDTRKLVNVLNQKQKKRSATAEPPVSNDNDEGWDLADAPLTEEKKSATPETPVIGTPVGSEEEQGAVIGTVIKLPGEKEKSRDEIRQSILEKVEKLGESLRATMKMGQADNDYLDSLSELARHLIPLLKGQLKHALEFGYVTERDAVYSYANQIIQLVDEKLRSFENSILPGPIYFNDPAPQTHTAISRPQPTDTATPKNTEPPPSYKQVMKEKAHEQSQQQSPPAATQTTTATVSVKQPTPSSVQLTPTTPPPPYSETNPQTVVDPLDVIFQGITTTPPPIKEGEFLRPPTIDELFDPGPGIIQGVVPAGKEIPQEKPNILYVGGTPPPKQTTVVSVEQPIPGDPRLFNRQHRENTPAAEEKKGVATGESALEKQLFSLTVPATPLPNATAEEKPKAEEEKPETPGEKPILKS